MRKSELIVYGIEEGLATRLEAWAHGRGIWFRGVSEPDTVVNLLRQGSRGVVVARLGRDLHRELEVLHLAALGFPEVAVFVIGDVSHPELEALVLDLGAACTLFSAHDADQLLEWLPRLFGT